MPVLIIAEAGVNHNGSPALARQMALAAKQAGADVVKFQTCVPELVASRFAQKAAYQKQQTGAQESQLEMIRRLHFGFEEHMALRRYCEEIGICYLSTAFDLPYLERMAAAGRPLLVSTGMCEKPEIAAALQVLRGGGAGKITLLHCNTEYPTPFEDANLRAMQDLAQTFGCPVGYSDHTPGVEAAVAAVALGAVVIEKHFTLDKSMEGPDQKASLSVSELQQLCSAIRHVEAAMGDGKKHVTASEAHNRAAARKSIVAARPIAAGETYTAENLTVKRPGIGVSPMHWYQVLGQRAPRAYEADECIEAALSPQEDTL